MTVPSEMPSKKKRHKQKLAEGKRPFKKRGNGAKAKDNNRSKPDNKSAGSGRMKRSAHFKAKGKANGRSPKRSEKAS